MSDRKEFEKWFEQYMGIGNGTLKRFRYTDVDGDHGYRDLSGAGFTEEADALVTMALQAWQAAQRQSEGGV